MSEKVWYGFTSKVHIMKDRKYSWCGIVPTLSTCDDELMPLDPCLDCIEAKRLDTIVKSVLEEASESANKIDEMFVRLLAMKEQKAKI